MTVPVPTLRGLLVVGLPLMMVCAVAARLGAPVFASILVEEASDPRGDVIVVEVGAYPNPGLFAHAQRLASARRAPRIALTEYQASTRLAEGGIDVPANSTEILRAYWRDAGIDDALVATIPVQAVDPVTFNLARQVADWCRAQRVRTIILVTTRFHSRRSTLSLRRHLRNDGIAVLSSPAPSGLAADNWWQTKDGIDTVILEWVRFAYYRAFLL